jgi:hypothetical protein
MQFSKNWARRTVLACMLTALPLTAAQRSNDRYAGVNGVRLH